MVSAPLDRVPLNLPKADQLKTDPVEWFVITPDNADDVFAVLEKQGTDTVIFGVTDDGYENLSVNIAKILKLVEQQKLIIDAYENYYVQQERAINQHLSESQRLKDSVTKQ